MAEPPSSASSARASWSWLSRLRPTVRSLVEVSAADYAKLMVEWQGLLAPLGGDPSCQDWSRFRPLRLSREEDWSDWLAHLLGASESGGLAQDLLAQGSAAPDAAGWARADVAREVSVDGGSRRADLLLGWPGRFAHVEVKLWDSDFHKTFETAEGLRRRFGRHGEAWSDFVLLPAGARDEWDRVVAKAAGAGRPAVRVITWDDVAVALRRRLRRQDEPAAWRAWALAFCGAVEQTILEIPRREEFGEPARLLGRLDRVLLCVEVMQRSLA